MKCLILVALCAWLMYGCAPAGYLISAGGALHTELEFQDLKDRVDHLESVLLNPLDQDIWK